MTAWVVAGPAGSGKTTLGRALARSVGAALLDLDSVTNPVLDGLADLVAPDGHWNDARRRDRVRPARYAALLAAARDQVRAGVDMVLVAPFTAEMRGGAEWEELRSSLAPAAVRVVWLRAEPDLLAARVALRGESRDAGRPATLVTAPLVDHVAVDAAADTREQVEAARGDFGGSRVRAMTWTAPAVDRHDPPDVASERVALDGWLDFHRETLLWKCAGLSADQLRVRPVTSSTLSLLGLVRHMAMVERWWFQRNVCGRDVALPYWSKENPDGEFDDVDSADAEADFALFAQEVVAAREAVADLPLEHTFVSAGHRKVERDLRWVYVHMIEEYARHNGHADLIREMVDGTTGD